MIIEITDINDSRISPYVGLTEAQLRNRLHADRGIFIAESPKVIRVALSAGYEPISMLCEERHITGDAADIIQSCPDIDIYTGSRDLLTTITGYKLTRGVLCAMRRKPLPSVKRICADGHRVAVIHGVTDTTNIGSIFRSAAALGIDAVVLSSDSCDPLNRRAVRVSMGTIFLVPWTFSDHPLQELNRLGYKTAALALSDNSVSIDDPLLSDIDKLAMILGTEGDGLPASTIAEAAYTVRIPMHHQVDSLNVGAAAAVAFWQLRHAGVK